jgi:sialidase-1
VAGAGVAWTLATLAAAEVSAPVDVFVAGRDGYPKIRIPSVIAAADGTLLAFAEGRQGGDQSHNDILLKRSSDGGATWGPLQVVTEMGEDHLNNPCAVLERGSGRVFLMFQQYPAHVHERSGIQAGSASTNTVRSWIAHSDDHGATWSKPADITRDIKPDAATTLASGPGIGIQLAEGPHAGRLVMPFNRGPYGAWQVFAAYSDDKGRTWKHGGEVPGGLETNAQGRVQSRVNEVQMAELPGGAVLLNSRSQTGPRNRTQAVSRDGGETWSPLRTVPELFDGPCMASLVRAGRMLYFSGPMKPQRAEGALWASHNDGETWRRVVTIEPGAFAYSCLVPLPGGDLGCLYERGGYASIAFVRIPPEAP